MAASDIVGGIGGVASAIPYVGPIIGAVTSIAGGIMKNKEAADQAARAEELRKKSEATQKMALRPEYLKSLKSQEMAALYGLPGFNQYKENIDEGVAKNARAIAESSPSGAATLNTISAVLANANKAKNDLYIADADAQAKKQAQVAQTLWNTGDKQMDLVGLQRADKAALNQGAMNLENAATANKVGSIDQILSTVGAFGSSIGKMGIGEGGANKTLPTTATSTVSNPSGGGLMNSDIYNLQNSTFQPNIPAGMDKNTLSSVLAFLKANPQYNSSWAKGS